MEPIVLPMDVHCSSCAEMIRASLLEEFGTYEIILP
jgi:hypothetical protein